VRTIELVVLVALVGCGSDAAKPLPELAQYLSGIEDRAAEIATWRLDEATWRRITVEPYRARYADYVREFDTAAPALAASLGGGPFEVRDHFADDPQLTLGQARTRWALPVLAKAKVTRSIDAVFVEDGNRWRAIVGLDRVVTRAVSQFDAVCAERIDAPGATKTCRSAAWQVADGALRKDRERVAHACSLAMALCGTPSP
jgi:hypothetical protein